MSHFCPQCRTEYREGFKKCSDCGSDLVNILSALPGNQEDTGSDMVPVFDAPDQLSAIAIASFLNDNGIRAVIKSEQIPMYDGVAMMLFPRWGQVVVLEPQSGEARKLIDDYLSGQMLDEEGQTPDK